MERYENSKITFKFEPVQYNLTEPKDFHIPNYHDVYWFESTFFCSLELK